MRYYHDTMLPEQAFKPLGGKMTFEGGGSSSPGPTTQTSYTASVQPELMPYATDIAQNRRRYPMLITPPTKGNGLLTLVQCNNKHSKILGGCRPIKLLGLALGLPPKTLNKRVSMGTISRSNLVINTKAKTLITWVLGISLHRTPTYKIFKCKGRKM